jgi:hypothetical protein
MSARERASRKGEGISGLPEGASLKRQFSVLLERIAKDGLLDEDTRALAEQKTEAIAEGLGKVMDDPGPLRRALIDAKSWFVSAAKWVGKSVGDILKGEAAQKTIGTVTEAATKAAIDSFLI